MQRDSNGWMGALLGMSLAVTAIGPSEAKAAITRSEHCDRLSLQLDQAIQTKAETTEVAEAMSLQKTAIRFCAERKQAQGIRTLANALKLLGVTPDDQAQ
ncbi:hypothetical protein [Mesorhizobium kowhaii]|uniref:Uncharacterized protein n=1 Tax=Mesorhizobium kowhaii TaxID=1300272 RepID=A0A2W7C8S8_9HYPH|nr:hypothetical protein [Mesorhizobium kowhaii]PZV39590.1 hypothetical protein B5V02_06475 [Mesorhizobium kowhaii]